MADENTAAEGTPAPAAADPGYKAELAAMLAAEQAEQDAADAPPEKKPEPPKAEDAEPKSEENDDAEEADEDEDADEPDADEEGDEDGEGEEEPEGKSKYSKALRTLQKEKESLQEFKTKVLADQKAVVAERERLKGELVEFRSFVQTFKRDPAGTLIRAGLMTDEDIGYMARQLYLMSPEAAKDPRSKQEAERLRREYDREQEHRKTAAEVEKLRQEREAERRQAQQDAEINAYVTKVNAAADSYKAKTPELEKALSKAPERTRRELLRVAHELSEAKGELADPKLVVLAWTKQRKQLLAELADAGAAVAVEPPKKDKSKKPAEQKGATDAQRKTETAPPPADDEDKPGTPAYKRKLRAMLSSDD